MVVRREVINDMDHPSDIFAHCRLGIVDNDPLSLAALAELVRREIDFASLSWTTTNAQQALGHLKVIDDIPDILLVDMSLEGISGPSLCRRIRMDNGQIRILAITSFSLSTYRDKACEAGVQGLVSKNDEAMLIESIRLIQHSQVMEGFETPALAHARLRHTQPMRLLTRREEEIIDLIAQRGMMDREVGHELGIAEATVRKHMHNIMGKLGARTARQAVAIWLSER